MARAAEQVLEEILALFSGPGGRFINAGAPAQVITDNAANPTAQPDEAFQMVWNGVGWDRQKGDNTGVARASLYAQGTVAGDTALKAVSAAIPQLRVTPYDAGGAAFGSHGGNNDSVGVPGTFYDTLALPHLYDGASVWNRQRNNHEVTALVSAVRAASTNSADLVNYNARGVHLEFDITAVPGGDTVTLTIQGKSTLTGKYYTILAGAAQVAGATIIMRVYPGLVAAGNLAANDILPRIWRVSIAHSAGTNFTYSVVGNYIL